MEEDPLQSLRNGLLDPMEDIRAIKQRNDELTAQETDLMTRRNAAQSAGETVPDIWHDATYQSIQVERQKIRASMNEYLSRPRMTKEQQAELRHQLRPDEKRKLRGELLQTLQSLPPEQNAALTATVEKLLRKVTAENEATPELEASLARTRKIHNLINQAEETA